MREKKETPPFFIIIQQVRDDLESLDSHSLSKGLDVHSGNAKELNRSHPQVLECSLGNGPQFLFRLFMDKGKIKILKGNGSMLSVEVKCQSSQLSSEPKCRIFGKKVDE